MVARLGASMPAPLAMPPTVTPSPEQLACLGTVSVVRMASAAAGPPDGDRSATALSTPASSGPSGKRTPMSPVEHTATSPAPTSSSRATCSAVAWVSPNPGGPVQALAPARVEDDCPQPPVADHLPGPQHRSCRKTVGGEHAGGGIQGAVVDDERHVRRATRLESCCYARGPEPGRRCHGHGATPFAVRPAVSGSPSMRLAHCKAWPAAPLPRLSMAATTTARPAARSAVT